MSPPVQRAKGTGAPVEDSSLAKPPAIGLVQRLGLELTILMTLALLEVLWWHLRGRYSMAPTSSEYVDGGIFLGTTTGIYIATRLVLYVAGKGLAVVYRAGSGAVAAFWTALAGAAGLGMYTSGAWRSLSALVKKEIIGDALMGYLNNQYPDFQKEGYFYLRLLALLVVWQCLFAVAYWLLRTVLYLPTLLLPGRRKKQPSGTETEEEE